MLLEHTSFPKLPCFAYTIHRLVKRMINCKHAYVSPNNINNALSLGTVLDLLWILYLRYLEDKDFELMYVA